MANMIEQNPIAGASVYGVEQYSYTVNGVAGKDYAAALSAASFKEAVAIEQALSAYSEVVRQRMRKLDDLGTVMAILNEAYATLKTKEQESGDTTANMPSLAPDERAERGAVCDRQGGQRAKAGHGFAELVCLQARQFLLHCVEAREEGARRVGLDDRKYRVV